MLLSSSLHTTRCNGTNKTMAIEQFYGWIILVSVVGWSWSLYHKGGAWPFPIWVNTSKGPEHLGPQQYSGGALKVSWHPLVLPEHLPCTGLELLSPVPLQSYQRHYENGFKPPLHWPWRLKCDSHSSTISFFFYFCGERERTNNPWSVVTWP